MSMRTALVTGASRGIGRACALALASAGHRVVLAARSAEKLAEVAKEIGTENYILEMDLANRDSITNDIAQAAKDFGRIDVLVNNAGIAKDGLAVRMKQADWEAVLSTNLSGAFYAIQQVLQGMILVRYFK